MSNTETVAVILGITFVGIILICLVWTIMSYIAESSAPNNKLEDNIKEYDRQKR
tara:strand:+ start:699 stop:860 length:162 start_codon:yes stop_codon:yes gene_type:complete